MKTIKKITPAKLLTRSFMFICLISIVSCCKPGMGGDATVVASPTHHGTPIQDSTVIYIKYNTKTFPGTNPSDYDASFKGTHGDPSVKCSGLKCGNYYFYAVGWDTLRLLHVTGGIAVQIKHKQRKQTINLNIAVTE